MIIGTLKNRRKALFSDNNSFCQKVRGVSMNPVQKGKEFEERVLALLTESGLSAVRTNRTNEYDPANYKHGFDGGVDIIATYKSEPKYNKGYTFYIQCKCHKNDLTKTAIAEVFAGVHARHADDWGIIPVVFTESNASQETIQYAKELNVELILRKDIEFLQEVARMKHAPYGNYGVLLKILIYNYTKETIWIETLPTTINELSTVTETEILLQAAKADFDNAQAYIDKALIMERRANEERQKALDIQKIAVYRAIEISGIVNRQREQSTKQERPKTIEDTG